MARTPWLDADNDSIAIDKVLGQTDWCKDDNFYPDYSLSCTVQIDISMEIDTQRKEQVDK